MITIALSLLFIGAGLAVIVKTITTPAAPSLVFPRFGAPPAGNPRFLPVAVGAMIALSGVALLLVSRAELSL